MSPFSRLLASSAGAHLGDQLAVAALPLTAVLVLGAGPGTVGVLVGVQGLAWLLVSLPAGVLADRLSKPALIAAAQGVAAAAFLGAGAAAVAGPSFALAAACFAGAGGAVILSLCALALVPELVPAERLPAANARLELARAAATLLAPIAAGLLAERASPALGFAAAALACAAAAFAASSLSAPTAASRPAKPPLLDAIREGARFALRHALLRGIALCAVFWNFAFFALLAVAVPFALERIGLDPAQTGLAQAGYGLGLLLGAACAGRVLARFEPRVVLIAGPALSLLSPLLLMLAARGGGLPAAGAALLSGRVRADAVAHLPDHHPAIGHPAAADGPGRGDDPGRDLRGAPARRLCRRHRRLGLRPRCGACPGARRLRAFARGAARFGSRPAADDAARRRGGCGLRLPAHAPVVTRR